MNVLMIIISVVAIIAILYFLFPRVLICGNSMNPTYKDDEIVWATRIFRRKNLKKGDVVVVHFKTVEDGQHRTVIKRITQVSDLYKERKIYIEGDNPKESYDSRMYGFIPASLVIAKILKPRRNMRYFIDWDELVKSKLDKENK